jgi:hypothetical protein
MCASLVFSDKMAKPFILCFEESLGSANRVGKMAFSSN